MKDFHLKEQLPANPSPSNPLPGYSKINNALKFSEEKILYITSKLVLFFEQQNCQKSIGKIIIIRFVWCCAIKTNHYSFADYTQQNLQPDIFSASIFQRGPGSGQVRGLQIATINIYPWNRINNFGCQLLLTLFFVIPTKEESLYLLFGIYLAFQIPPSPAFLKVRQASANDTPRI